jgi:hypothetical protein
MHNFRKSDITGAATDRSVNTKFPVNSYEGGNLVNAFNAVGPKVFTVTSC